MIDQRIRQALQAYQRREGITQREHARRMGVPQMTLSDYLRLPDRRLSMPVLAGIRHLHPEMDRLLDAWLDEQAQERARIAGDGVAQTPAEPAAVAQSPPPLSRVS